MNAEKGEYDFVEITLIQPKKASILINFHFFFVVL